MEVDLTPEQREFVRMAVEAGRLPGVEAALEESMSLWVERERRRLGLLAALQQADASMSEGEGRVITEGSMKTLAEEVKTRGLAHLAGRRHLDTSSVSL